MKRTKTIRVVLGLMSGLALLRPAYAEPVAPRFPDTVLPGLPPGNPAEPLAGQGQLEVSGVLLVSPCILSHWALETQGKSWMSREQRQVTLALEGCGDGATQFGLVRAGEVPLPVSGRWVGDRQRYALRLHNGENYLSLPTDPVAAFLELEMDYE